MTKGVRNVPKYTNGKTQSIEKSKNTESLRIKADIKLIAPPQIIEYPDIEAEDSPLKSNPLKKTVPMEQQLIAKILNESKAGKQAQDLLKKKFETDNKKFSKLEKTIRAKEKELIGQKKVITNEEYKKKAESLRAEVKKFQDNRTKSINKIGEMRNKYKVELLKALNPIIADYMKEKKIRLVLDKKSILLGDNNLDITEEIISLLNKKLTSIKLN